MASKITGIDNFTVYLRNTADKVADSARKTMKRSADRITAEAKINCPEDTSALMKSIRQEKSYEARDAGCHGGRLQIEVTFGGMVDGEDTDEYAMEVHEHYEGMLTHGPGHNTLAKMAAYPDHTIGSKFLERAAETERPKLEGKMIEIVEGVIEGREPAPLPEIPTPEPRDAMKTAPGEHGKNETKKPAQAMTSEQIDKEVMGAVTRAFRAQNEKMNYTDAAKLHDVRNEMKHISRSDQDASFLRLRNSMKLNFLNLDNPRHIDEIGDSKWVMKQGVTFHIVWPM